MAEQEAEQQQEEVTRIPAGVWAISSVSLFMQISNSLVYSLFPVYQLKVLVKRYSMQN